jgi:diguanylate cyclase (GGDEF)-like protein
VANDNDSTTRLGRLAGMRRFRWQIALLITVYTIVVYGALYLQTQRMLEDQLRAQGASYFDLVKQTRAWSSNYGGVWVVKTHGVETNEYLTEIGIPADIKTESGAELTLRNPAAMTVEISELTEEESGVSFHLTGIDPINPANNPDAWEESSLEQLESGDMSYAETIDRSMSPNVYRYMEALIVDETCIGCHREGYELATLQGAVTVNIPTETVDAQLRQTGIVLALLGLVTLGLGVGASQLLVNQLQRRLDTANEILSTMAVTDELTGLANRRSAFEGLAHEFSRSKRSGEPMSVIVIDIDHFKSVNDRHGHAVGDAVLRAIADRMNESTREYDILGRIGGEEFLVIAPQTSLEAATALANRILERVRSEPVSAHDLELTLTLSAGVSVIGDSDERGDTLVARADDAMYVAKNAGRDCVKTQADLEFRPW